MPLVVLGSTFILSTLYAPAYEHKTRLFTDLEKHVNKKMISFLTIIAFLMSMISSITYLFFHIYIILGLFSLGFLFILTIYSARFNTIKIQYRLFIQIVALLGLATSLDWTYFFLQIGALYGLHSLAQPYLKKVYDEYAEIENAKEVEENIWYLKEKMRLSQWSVNRASIEELKTRDPYFAEVLFLDYAQLVIQVLYMQTQDEEQKQRLSPFIHSSCFPYANSRYSQLVVNAMQIQRVDLDMTDRDGSERIYLIIDLNFTEERGGQKRELISKQLFVFERHSKQKSLPPECMRALVCPSCSAPNSFEFADNTCSACGTEITPRSLQWYLSARSIAIEETYQDSNLVAYSPEKGTDDLTVFDSKLRVYIQDFTDDYNIKYFGEYQKELIENMVKPSFLQIYRAWEEKNWAEARHVVSDFLYQTYDFWMQEYEKKGYTNKLDDLQIDEVELVKIERNYYYEVFTFRIFAACKDYTIKDDTGEVLGGSKDELRRYSEYWTFVCRRGKEQPNTSCPKSCPACSAPLDKMGMNAICGYCDNKISTGDFSWVLSRITQDEVYRG